jgi:ATP-dependent RNA helicase DHX29
VSKSNTVTPEDTDAAVSDLDSDLEPDQLIPTYLKVKGKLFEIDPEALDSKPRKIQKKPKGRTGPTAPVSSTVRKLQSQLQQLESDALFDRDEAEALWPARRNQIAQEKATQRNAQKPNPTSSEPQHLTSPPSPHGPIPNSPSHAVDNLSDAENELLGDMFATPSESTAVAVSADESSVTLRDFGKQSGLPPRRLLEESVKAR